MLRVLLGTPPALPERVDADMIRSLRGPDGKLGCAEGVSAAIEWIGDQLLPLDEALALAKEDAGLSGWMAEDVAWAEAALGVIGYGYVYGDVYGDGDSYSYGYVYGDGDSYGDSRGYGYGDGYVDSCFDGDGYGDAYGNALGEGYGSRC